MRLWSIGCRGGVDDNIVLGFSHKLGSKSIAVMELPAELVLCGLGSRQQLLHTSIITHGQQRRSIVPLLVGRAGAQVSDDYDVPVRDQMLAHLRLCNELVMLKTYVEFVLTGVLCDWHD